MPSIHCVHPQPQVSTRGGDGRSRSTLAKKSRGNSELRLMKTMSEKIRWKAHRTKLDLNVDFWPSHAYTQTTTTTHTHNIHIYKYTRMYRHKIFEAIQYNLYMSIPISKTSWLDRNLTTKVK